MCRPTSAGFEWRRSFATRWDQNSIFPKYAPKPDQLEFLISVAYRTESESRRVAGRKLGLGVIASLAITRGFQSFDGATEPERTRYLAGLTAVVSVSHDIRIEADATYKPLRAGGNDLARFSLLTWHFPALAKYSLLKRAFGWQPFAEGGPSFRLSGNLNGYNPSHYGVTTGAGLRQLCVEYCWLPDYATRVGLTTLPYSLCRPDSTNRVPMRTRSNWHLARRSNGLPGSSESAAVHHS